ncbi:MAG: branched-chain amino acid ABC transporter permease [Propionibacteriales bacterium]|nr:branched-chain amino acid ABC transporter permease [Propionibacteriales bacterium]
MRVRATAIIAGLIAVVSAAFLLPASTASAAPAGDAPHVRAAALEPSGPLIKGTLVDETDPQNPEPVEGVVITVEDEEGNEVGTETSNAEGFFEIEVPGSGTYTVIIDTDTLPEGRFLRNEDQVQSTATVMGFDKTVQFPIGPDTRQVAGLTEKILERAVTGVLFGLLLALAALGLSMIFGTTGLTNFAHGELVAFGAIVAYLLNVSGLPVIAAGAIAVVCSALFGWMQDLALWRRLRHRGTSLIAMMIVSIGMAISLRALYQYFIGGSRRVYSQYATPSPIFESLSLTLRDVIVMTFALAILVAVSIALQTTRTGKAMRAIADNPPLAASSGINVDRVVAVVWTGGAALAGLGGFLYALKFQLDYQLGLRLLLLIFAAVILGGLGTIWGAMFGALIISMFVELSTLVIPAELKYTGALGVLIVILLIRPQGLLNRAQRVG